MSFTKMPYWGAWGGDEYPHSRLKVIHSKLAITYREKINGDL